VNTKCCATALRRDRAEVLFEKDAMLDDMIRVGLIILCVLFGTVLGLVCYVSSLWKRA
jgi:hypothetical protein